MSETTVALPASQFSRPAVRVLLIVLAVLAAALYFARRSVRSSPTAGPEADTVCVAARIGLPCRN